MPLLRLCIRLLRLCTLIHPWLVPPPRFTWGSALGIGARPTMGMVAGVTIEGGDITEAGGIITGGTTKPLDNTANYNLASRNFSSGSLL